MRMRRDRAPGHMVDSESSVRVRLLDAMLAAVEDEGYGAVSVASVIARAGVARRTFYAYFTDKDDCFLALYRQISRSLVDQIARAVTDSPPEQALDTVVRQLTEHAETQPVQAQFLASDALAAGPPALHEREQTITQISASVERAYALLSPLTGSPDLPAPAVVGATHSLISQRVRQGERNLAQLTQELTHWLKYYQRPVGKHRWSALSPGPQQESSLHVPQLAGQSAPPRSKSELADSHLWRILSATAESAAQTGYSATTIAAITARARIHKRVFYRHFHDKRQAFLAVHELALQQSMAVGAAAYFGTEQWPERVWRCLLAGSQFQAAYPAIAHVGLIEAHALGMPAIQRIEETRHAFATLLRADRQSTSPLPGRTVAEAIGAAIFEISHGRVLNHQDKDLPRYAYHATYLALAPFLGVQAANRFVQGKLEDAQRKPTSRKRRKRS
jgi:AcrR family transcriptional regulator